MKNLARIERIDAVEEHDNADALDIVTVKGWKVISKRGEFTPGRLCVYIEIDSLVPKQECFAFLEKVKYRVKTIRLRGRLSQGIVFPLDILDNDWVKLPNGFKKEIGADVTDILGVQKYEKPIPMDSQAIGPFPTHLCAKTDETRIQNFHVDKLLDFFRRSGGLDVKMKHDGSSMTVAKNPEGEVYLCSRNQRLNADKEDSVFAKMFHKYNLGDIPKNHVVQCEVIGPKIQGNKEELATADIRVFNVFKDRETQMDAIEMDNFCNSRGLPTAETIYAGDRAGFFELLYEVLELRFIDFALKPLSELLLDFADTLTYRNGAVAEGMVMRPTHPFYDNYLCKNFSFKCVSNKFLLKNKE